MTLEHYIGLTIRRRREALGLHKRNCPRSPTLRTQRFPTSKTASTAAGFIPLPHFLSALILI